MPAQAPKVPLSTGAVATQDITPQEVRRLMQLVDGVLTYQRMVPRLMPIGRYRRTWNRTFSGKPVRVFQSKNGYLCFVFSRRRFAVHRVVWLLHHGKWPDGMIDHVNGDRSDNRIENLRVVTPAGNVRNCSLSRNNTSGMAGVCYLKDRDMWRVNVANKFVGNFRNKEDAFLARFDAQRRQGFSDRHGLSAEAAEVIHGPVAREAA